MPRLRKHSTASRLASLEARARTLEILLEATLRVVADHIESDHSVTRAQEETK